MSKSKYSLDCVLRPRSWPLRRLPRPLKIVNVTAPDINCVFDPSCKLTVTDSAGDIVIPNVTGKAILQSRTFSGAAGAPGAGLTGYEYRVDLTQASIMGESAGCVTDMTVDFGPVTQLQYNKAGPDDDVYVVTKGGLGSVGLLSADFHGQQDHLHLRAAGMPGIRRQQGRDELLLRPCVQGRAGGDHGQRLGPQGCCRRT